MVFVFLVLNWEFRMGFPSILAFLVVSHLLLLHSSGCPDAFDCGPQGQIKFPFSNMTPPLCGLCSVDCGKPLRKINFGVEGRWYQVDGELLDDKPIKINDPGLKDRINSRDCDLPSYLHLQNTSSVSFTFTPNLTMFKCKTDRVDLYLQAEKYFFGNHTYTSCPGSIVYYTYSNRQVQVPTQGSYPDNCVAIQLPLVSPKVNLDAGDLFSLLASEFSLELHVSDKCRECHGKGGQCRLDTPDFNCYHENETNGEQPNEKQVAAGRSHLPLILATVIPGGVVLLLVLLILIRYRKKWRNHSFSYIFWRNPSSKQDFEEGSVYYGVPVFSYTDLKEATHNFDPSKELGDGGFGIVYHGKLRDGREVAVKRLYEHNYKRVAQFTNEIEILTQLRHRNLVTLYGCTSRHSRELLLVYEYIPNGTVADHLHGDRAKDGSLAWPIRMNIAIETASALVYLHAHEIIHRDVKTNNILLDDNFGVKVADFGLSRLFPNDISHVSTAPQGTPGYVDPDYRECYQLTYKSDVYSFGVVLIELISSLPAVDIDRHRHEINLANLAINRIQNGAFNELIDPSLGFESDSSVERMTTSVAEVAFRCLQREKEMRPRMDEVLEALNEIQEYKDDDMEKRPPPSPDGDNVVLLKNSKEPPSPDSVTTPWISGSSTSIGSG